jgi:hypothetical protein
LTDDKLGAGAVTAVVETAISNIVTSVSFSIDFIVLLLFELNACWTRSVQPSVRRREQVRVGRKKHSLP